MPPAGLKGLVQPYASFGGALREDAAALARKSDPFGLDIGVRRVYPGAAEGQQEGALGSATVEFDVTLKHINTNMNSNTQGE